ncbi:GPI mannosyltransferase 2 [Spinellus fusiger]|nr:GPI mannosyltransferase 2 [Spinellus fusiger]
MKTLHRVYAFAAVTRLVTLFLGIASYLYTGSYDTSAETVLSCHLTKSTFVQRCLTALLRWDALYFLHIAEHGYVYEQEYAFFPMMPVAARLLSDTLLSPLHNALGNIKYTLILGGAIVSNVSFVLAAGALYKLGRTLFPRHGSMAFVSSVAFCLSPPSMFMSSFYTESLFAYTSFMGMYWVARKHYLSASVVWGLASLTRSNAIIYTGFFIYEFIVTQMSLCTGIVWSVLYSLPVLSGFVGFQYYAYTEFCTNGHDRPWCHFQPPFVYNFVQKEYWNNGFLAYYEMKQIPNFLLAAPIILLSIAGLWVYIQEDWKHFISLGAYHTRKNDLYTSNRVAVYMYLWAFLVFYTTTCMHVQVILRFFTSLPPLYWFIAHLWIEGFNSSCKYRRWIAESVLTYCVLYGCVGIVLFAGFLPPA